jgi:hypothetical protein
MGRSNVNKRLSPRHSGRACGIQAHSQHEPEWGALGKFASLSAEQQTERSLWDWKCGCQSVADRNFTPQALSQQSD